MEFADINLTWDLGVVGFVFLSALIYGLSLGRKKLLTFLVSTYTAFALFILFPFFDNIQDIQADIDPQIILLGVFAFFLFLSYYIYSGSMIRLALPIPKRGNGPYWQAILLSISIAGLLLSIVFYIYDFAQAELSDYVRIIFINEVARFGWILAPAFVAALMRKKI